MRCAVCMSHSRPRPQPSAVDDARFRGSSVYIQDMQTCMNTVTRPTDRPTDRPGVMGGSWPGIRVYICTCTVCTSPKTRGDSRRLRAAGCGLRAVLEPLLQLAPLRTWDVGRRSARQSYWRSSGKSRSSQSLPVRLIERQTVVRRSCLRVGPAPSQLRFI